MDTVFQNINCVFVYLDDILIASSNPHQHIEDLHMVYGRLKQFGLTIRLEKCIFGASEIDFLGHEICKNDQCLQCQRSKIQTHTHCNTLRYQQNVSVINIDIVGPLPPSSGFTHLTIMDRTTRWLEAIPLRDITTTEYARALISTWIARFGVSLDMTSAMWSTISSQFGIQVHRTTAYHPHANGLVARFIGLSRPL